MINSMSINKMKRKIFISLLLLGVVPLILSIHLYGETGELSADKSKGVKEPEVLMHDYGDLTEDVLKYWGNVEFIWEDYRVYADYVEYHVKEKLVVARGRVTMTSKDTVVSGEQLSLNLKDGTGLMYDVYGQMHPTVRYTADKWTRLDEDTYKFKNFRFTSCAQCVPRWRLTCTRGKIKREKYLEMTNVVLKIKKIPVLYLPYLSYPIKDRATGFLFPVFGESDLKGFYIQNSFFWDIKDNVDLTLNFDYLSKAGMGAAEEFRYLFRNLEGYLKFYYFKYRLEEVEEKPGSMVNIFGKESEYDYYINLKHIQRINFLDTRIVADVDNQSDPSFLRLFDNNFDRSLSNRYYSSIYLKSSLSNINFSVNARKNVTFYTFAGTDTSNIVQYLPSISLDVNQQKIWKIPGYFSLNSIYESVRRSGVSYEEGEELFQPDFTSQRINLIPSYMLNILQLPWLSSTVTLQSKHSFYRKSRDPKTKKILDEPLHLNYNMVTASLKGPTFYRIYEGKKNKLKHLIEPQVEFRYSTQVEEDIKKRLVPVDYFDRPPYSYIGFGITTRFLKKSRIGQESPTEIFSYTISQDYYFDPAEANYYRKIEGEYPVFSELSNRLRFRLVEDFSLDISLGYNYYIKQFNRLYILLSLNKEDSFLKGSLSYTTYKNPYKESYYLNKTYIRGDLDFNIPGFPLKFITGVDYDLTEKEFRYGSFLASYNYQCIKFNVEFRVLTRMGGTFDYQYNFGISFGDIGVVKDFLGEGR